MDYDLCIIGGGVNGTAIARDAAGRGLSVLLVEAQDLGNATSSASTKLVHGGLRYLEHYEFKLVRESLLERAILLKNAPHIIWPLEFILPHDKNLRPYSLIQLGLKLYDFLAGHKKLQSSKSLDFATDATGDPLKDEYERGFSYADCWVEDSRFVVLNAVDAFERGATIMPRTACIHLEPSYDKEGWDVFLEDMLNKDRFQIKARQVVNVSGPWVRSLLDNAKLTGEVRGQKCNAANVRLVKGSHIIVPKIYDGAHSYILQQLDKRIVFAIPYEKNFTLIGTTEKPLEGDPSSPQIDDDEITYLCDAINRSFKKQISKEDVVTSFSGVRPLVDDGEKNASEVTRDYKLYLDKRFGPPILSIFGGKITTSRKLAEDVVNRISTFYPNKKMKAWTEYVPLPGGDFEADDFNKLVMDKKEKYNFMPDDLLRRYTRAYGTRLDTIIGKAQSIEELGVHYGDGLYEAEVLYLLRYEFAMTSEDILWRRSKLLLHVTDNTKNNLERALPELIQSVSQEGSSYAHFASH